jgi:hypothetical protein
MAVKLNIVNCMKIYLNTSDKQTMSIVLFFKIYLSCTRFDFKERNCLGNVQPFESEK